MLVLLSYLVMYHIASGYESSFYISFFILVMLVIVYLSFLSGSDQGHMILLCRMLIAIGYESSFSVSFFILIIVAVIFIVLRFTVRQSIPIRSVRS